MFRRRHHQAIGSILQQLNGDLLREYRCYFGGGTAIALLQNEYRESVDIDFLISDKDHYRELRNLLTDSAGIYAIAKEGAKLVLAREIKADQYGIRAMIQSGNATVKFEIVLEGRIVFDEQSPRNTIENISTLTKLDLLTSKLLANSDRWNDSAVYSRDILDLVMLSPTRQEFDAALKKAHQAYGDAIHRDLNKAAIKLLNQDESLDSCMRMLKIDLPKALLWQKLNDLVSDHMKILENNLAIKFKIASNDDLKKFIDQKLKSIDHILEYLKDK